MGGSIKQGCGARLERSCVPAGDRIRVAPRSPGLERIEARFSGHGFDPHRHDTYAIGFTIDGAQAFRYRRAARRSTRGQVLVLHPDEVHDGQAGTNAGFRYRILYLAPRLVHDALGEGPLPFVREAVSNNARLMRAIVSALAHLALPFADVQCDQVVADLGDALAASDPSRTARRTTPACRVAVERARAFLDEHARPVSSSELESVSGLSRYDLSRHFRARLGTSPYRYLVMRRLDRARALIRAGTPPADAAFAAGFADQSHMTRQFKQACGLSPGRFAALAA